MKRVITGVLFLLAMNLFAVTYAASPPLVMHHSLTGYSTEATSVTLDYSLHIVNLGDTPLADLSLSLVPLPPLIGQGTTVSIGYLGPQQSAQMFIKLASPALLDEERLSRRQLFWAGTYTDQEGRQVAFPLQSKPGGAR